MHPLLSSSLAFLRHSATPSLPAFFQGRVLMVALVLSGTAGFPAMAQETPPEAPAVEADTATDTFAPKEHPIDRYEKLRGKSPFEFELAKPALAPTENPFADLVLAGFAGSAGSPTVYLLNTKSQERITVYGEASTRPNKSGFKVIRVDRGRDYLSTSATVEKDGIQETLKFDKKILYSAVGGAAGGGAAAAARPTIPGQPGPPGQGPRPAIPGQARPQQVYQAPQAFIPGQGGRSAGGGQMTGGAFIPGQAQPPGQPVPGGIQLGMQPGGGQPANAVPAGATNAQQQLNALLTNSGTPGQAQPTVVPAVPQAPGTNNPPPRRRVVLPNTP